MTLTVAFLACAACSSDSGNTGFDGRVDPGVTPDQDVDACTSDAPYCSPDRGQVLRCDPATGAVTVVEQCGGGTLCIEGTCQATVCTPGSAQCLSESQSQVCRTDGSGWDVVDCGDLRKCVEDSGACEVLCMLRVFVLIDQSGSMSDLTPSKWEQSRQAMRQVLASTAAADDVEFGLGAFPTDGNCGVSGMIVYPIPVEPVDLIDDYFSSHSPNGNTPLLEAMKLLLVDTSANLNDPAYYNFILLISDGADTCYSQHCELDCGIFNIPCIIDCENRAEQELLIALADTTTALLEDLSIRTFVIGFGSEVAPAQLDAVAQHGGTVIGRWLDAADVTELTAALQQVIDEMLECNPVVL
jgi:hypothetical protein